MEVFSSFRHSSWLGPLMCSLLLKWFELVQETFPPFQTVLIMFILPICNSESPLELHSLHPLWEHRRRKVTTALWHFWEEKLGEVPKAVRKEPIWNSTGKNRPETKIITFKGQSCYVTGWTWIRRLKNLCFLDQLAPLGRRKKREVLSKVSLAPGIKRWEDEKFQRQQVRTANGSVTSELGDLEQADSSCWPVSSCNRTVILFYFESDEWEER